MTASSMPLQAVAYGAGLRASEVLSLKVSDIDSGQMVLRAGQGQGRKDQHAMLSPMLLDILREWQNSVPKKLF